MTRKCLVPAIMIALAAGAAYADDGEPENADISAPTAEECNLNPCIIQYEPEFFTRYSPLTALDMVRRVPGFQIDDGNESRGFGGAAGNVLINGERPSTKSEAASEILSRIPAGNVERIDLIRGQSGGLDLRGQSVAVNVILRTDTGGTLNWQVGAEQNMSSGHLRPRGSASYSDTWRNTQYTVGVEGRQWVFHAEGPERVTDGTGTLLERRDESAKFAGDELQASFNSETRLDDTVFHFNAQASYDSRGGGELSERHSQIAGSPVRQVLQNSGEDEFSYEVSADAEHAFTETFKLKAIGLYRSEDSESYSGLADPNADNSAVTISRSDTVTLETESILRLEADYTGIENHVFEASAEGAINTLDNEYQLFVDEGAGPVRVSVPGANTKVEEVRGDFSVSDSWTRYQWVVDSALAAEVSTITQTGDAGAERTFFFLKPSLTVTYSPSQERQLRFRALREAAQLDFFEFVSSTDFGDGELALGNPDLAPETTWKVDASWEQRFGPVGVVTLTLFHHWITDVQDVLPVGEGLEVPGNIGDGRRWGAEVKGSAPLDSLGLTNARLDFEALWRDSTVTDPVTGDPRGLSGERDWFAVFNFRQDFEIQKWAWGWDFRLRADEMSYGLDELDSDMRYPDFDTFVETTRWWGLKMRLEVDNLLTKGNGRDRIVYAGARGLSPVAFREFRERDRGPFVEFSVSGVF